MTLKIYKIKNKISLYLAKKIFKERLPLFYIFFNKFFRKIIANNNFDSEEIKKFHEDGFVKLHINLKEELDSIKDKLKIEEHNDNDKKVWFHLNEDDKKKFEEKIMIKLKDKINNLKKYFNSDINFANLRMYRILNAEKTEKEIYADRFHQDGYLLTYIKIHINMMDVGLNDGPMNIISRKHKKKFFKDANYADRCDYDYSYKDDNIIYKNTGKYGDCFLFSSPQCFHKAEIPSNFRDIMQLIFVATPKNYSLEKIEQIPYEKNEENAKLILFTKPYSLFFTIKIFLNYLIAKNL